MTDDQQRSEQPELTPQEDALVSAVLDGEADDEQRHLVEADPRLRERVALLERVRADLRVVSPPTDAERDRAVAAALAEAPGAAATVASIEDARRARWRRALGVAAAVAALLVAVPVVALTVGRGSETDSSSTSADLAAPTAGQAESGAAATSLPPVDPASIVDLGAVDTDDQLRAAVDTALADRSLAASSDEAAKPTTLPLDAFAARAAGECAATGSTTDTALGAAVLVATATWRGEPVLVTVHEGVPAVIVVQRDDCTVIARIDD